MTVNDAVFKALDDDGPLAQKAAAEVRKYLRWQLTGKTENDLLYDEIVGRRRRITVESFTRDIMRNDGYLRRIMNLQTFRPVEHWLRMGIPKEQLETATWNGNELAIWKLDTGKRLKDAYRGWDEAFDFAIRLEIGRVTQSEWRDHYRRLRAARKRSAAEQAIRQRNRDARNHAMQAATENLLSQIAQLAQRKP